MSFTWKSGHLKQKKEGGSIWRSELSGGWWMIIHMVTSGFTLKRVKGMWFCWRKGDMSSQQWKLTLKYMV